MSGKTTEILVRDYIDSLKNSELSDQTIITIKSVIGNPQIIEYEKQIGKQIFDFSPDEFTILFSKMFGEEYCAPSTYDKLVSVFRNFFDWYIDNERVIKNPMSNRTLTGKDGYNKMMKLMKPFSKEGFDELVAMIHSKTPEVRANYYELLLLLFFEGVSSCRELLEIKAENIDHENKAIVLPDRTIQLSDKCYKMLVYFNKVGVLAEEGDNRVVNFPLLSYHDSYFKFTSRRNETNISDRTQREMEVRISYVFNRINILCGTNITIKLIRQLGFYEYIKANYGEDQVKLVCEAKKMTSDIAKNIEKWGAEFGYSVNSKPMISRLRFSLFPYYFN